RRQPRVRLGVHLAHLEVPGDRGQDRVHRPARPAPGGPEVHQDRPRVVQHLALEVVLLQEHGPPLDPPPHRGYLIPAGPAGRTSPAAPVSASPDRPPPRPRDRRCTSRRTSPSPTRPSCTPSSSGTAS